MACQSVTTAREKSTPAGPSSSFPPYNTSELQNGRNLPMFFTLPEGVTQEMVDDWTQLATADSGKWKNSPDGKCVLCRKEMDWPCYCGDCHSFMCSVCYKGHCNDFLPAIWVFRGRDGNFVSQDMR